MSEHVGLTIKQLREQRKMSKSRLGREAGVSDAYIVQIEKGDRSPSRDVLRNIARVLRVPPHTLLIPAGLYSEDTISLAERLAEEDLTSAGRTRAAVDPAVWDRRLHSYFEEIETQEAFERGELRDYRDGLSDKDFWRQATSSWAPENWSNLTPADQSLIQQLINRIAGVEESEDQ